MCEFLLTLIWPGTVYDMGGWVGGGGCRCLAEACVSCAIIALFCILTSLTLRPSVLTRPLSVTPAFNDSVWEPPSVPLEATADPFSPDTLILCCTGQIQTHWHWFTSPIPGN